MEFEHKSVLLQECLENLNIKPDGIYVDGTLGGAGHSSEIASRLTTGTLIGLDQDEDALAVATERLKCYGNRVIILKSNFANIKNVLQSLEISQIDGLLLDIGVSSYQLDAVERGFSYNHNAELDMRMDRSNPLTARYMVNHYSRQELAEIIRRYGEEKFASRIAAFIDEARKKEEIVTTGQLVEIIKQAIPASARRQGPHPAKRTFQALRVAVNNELGVLEQVIDDSIDLLKPGGRLCIITFQSLEDRIVKQKFKQYAQTCTCPPDFPVCVCGRRPKLKILGAKGITPTPQELEENSRSRSARLRVAERTEN
ncbi:MAG: 16S rRNA (cytosine(1402)-N(4))-methyltransferase RsmH [Eubacteriales bacterium]